MLKTLWAEVKQGKIELLEQTELPEGTKVLVTLIPATESERWLQSAPSVPDADTTDTIWDNIEDERSISEFLDAVSSTQMA